MTRQLNNPSADDEAQIPLGVGDPAPAEEYAQVSRPRINNSTLALFAAFAAALIVLYLLGLQNKPRAASADQVQREEETKAAIQRLIGQKDSAQQLSLFMQSTEALVKKIQTYFDSQTQDFELSGNPFDRGGARPAEPSVTPAMVDPDTLDPDLLDVARAIQSLKVQAVMMGSPPAALINNKMVMIGNKLGKLTVSDIQPGRVLLTYGKRTFPLLVNAPPPDKE